METLSKQPIIAQNHVNAQTATDALEIITAAIDKHLVNESYEV